MQLFIYKNIIKITKCVFKVNSVQMRSFAKALHNQHVTAAALNEETFKGRILHYLNIDKEHNINASINKPKSLDLLFENQSNNLENISFEELVYSINSIRENRKRISFEEALQRFDIESSMRLSDLDITQTFTLLDAFMNIYPDCIIELKFYNVALKELCTSIDKLTKQELLKLFFYIGLQKKKYPQYKIILKKCMKTVLNDKFINNLTLEELCVICHSYFKTATKIENTIFLDKVKSYINNNLTILKDPPLFISLIKTLRHNRYQDDNLLSTIAATVFFNSHLTEYSFTILCHLLTLFADYYYYDENVTNFFTKKCLEELKESKSFRTKNIHADKQFRGKDIKRLLFCLSNFSYFKPMEKEEIETVIVPKILERIRGREFNNDIDSLIDIVLFLWILNYRAYQLVPYVMDKDGLKILEGKKTPSRDRLNLLLHCIFIEDRDLFNNLNIKPMLPQTRPVDFHLNRRPFLVRVLNILKTNKVQLETDLKRFEISYEIPYINIIGITGYKKRIYKAVYIEILDDVTCLKNVEEDAPIGLMELKLRLLNHKEEAIIVLSQKELEESTESELEEILIDEIKLVC